MIAITLTAEQARDGDRYDELADSDDLMVELRHDNGDITFVMAAPIPQEIG